MRAFQPKRPGGRSNLNPDIALLTPSRRELYPPIDPYEEGWLDVGNGHRLYWSESGSRSGIPVIFLHGGPGGGCVPAYRRFFDPARYRIVMVDQRGAGRSLPAACVEANTTQHLIADLEVLRQQRGISRWLIFGGSWGSTLGLAYGQAHPDSCLGFILRGVFAGTRAEVDWFLNGMGSFFPEAASAFQAPIPPSERHDLLSAYYRRLTNPDPDIHMPAAYAWATYESSCAALRVRGRDARLGSARFALSIARAEAHYFVHDCFLEPDQLFTDINKISHLPCRVVQGRYDVICPPVTARRLVDSWPGASLEIIEDAGHSALEPGIRAALVRATDWFGREALPE